MKKAFPLTLSLSFFILLLFLAGCGNGPVQIGDLLTVTVDSGGADVNEDGEVDFGILRPGEDTTTIVLTVTNTSGEELTVDSVDKTGSGAFSLSVDEVPIVLPAGETFEYTLTFTPVESGTETATVAITASDFPDELSIDLTGEGNYAPTALFGVTVSDAGTAAVNGFYTRDGMYDTGDGEWPKYTMSGTTDYNIYADFYDGLNWFIDDDFTTASSFFINYNETMVPQPNSWGVSDGTGPAPTLEIDDIFGIDGHVDEELTANYLFNDEEGDLEETDSAVYQWYRGDTPTGTFTPISGATQKNLYPDELRCS